MTASAPAVVRRLTARALLLGDRLDSAGLERADAFSTNPLAFRAGSDGFVALYRFGVAVMIGLSPLEEDDVLNLVKLRVFGQHEHVDDETAILAIAPGGDDRVEPDGPIELRDESPERMLVVCDALAKSVSLGRDEREVNAVFDVVEPFAASLAKSGRAPWRRRSMLKLIGETLIAQHRVSGRVAVEEKPDVLWDRPDLERLYARLEDEYELRERAGALTRKLDMIVGTARILTDILDADRATRLEATIVILIVAEILLTIGQLIFLKHA
ncbi:RMD1 family protein [Methylocella sp.]|uniref:RMD1 family protein n=1 Tax=Methylocella sp. TaxID=1978226 RepID=UPI00378452BD